MQRTINIPAIVLSSLIAGFSVWLYSLSFDFNLTEFSKALPGQATFSGLDIGKRSSYYFKALLLFSSILLIIYTILSNRISAFKVAKFVVTPIGVCALLVLTLGLLYYQNFYYSTSTYISLFILFSAFLLKSEYWKGILANKIKLRLLAISLALLLPVNTETKFLLLIAFMVCTEILIKYKRVQSLFLTKHIYPSFLLLASFLLYTQTPINDHFELFENANPANALMRVFKFGEIPFVDFLSSHLLSEQIPIYIYSFIYGYEPTLESFQWLNIFYPLAYLSYYYFLKTVINSSSWAFIIVLCFPFLEFIFPLNFWYAVVSIFLLYKYCKKPNIASALFVILWSIFLAFWRIDIAAAQIPAIVLFILVYAIKTKSYSSVINHWILTSSVVSAFGIGVFLWLNNCLNGRILANLTQALSYFGASQAHGYTLIAKNYSSIFFIAHHYIFPCIIALVVFVTILQLNFKGTNKSNIFIQFAILFLSFFYFFNAPRGLVRHGFIEGSDRAISSFFYLIISLFFTLKVAQKRRAFTFLAISTLVVFIAKFGGHTLAKPYFSKHFSAQNEKIDQSPFEISKKEKIDSLTIYINSQLEINQTFFDFSNTPMLYFYTQRLVPSYFNQSLQNEVTTKIQKINLQQIVDLNIPLVVFSHYPDNWWDNTDGVPNTVRYPVLANWIYKNYLPDTIIAGYQLWKRKDLIPLNHKMPEKVFYARKFELQYFPGFFQLEDSKNQLQKEYLPDEEIHLIKNKAVFRNIDVQLNQYLDIELFDNRTEMFFEVKFYHSKTNELLGTYSFRTKAGFQHYFLALWSQYNWHLKKPDLITLELLNAASENNNPIFKKVSIKEYSIKDEY